MSNHVDSPPLAMYALNMRYYDSDDIFETFKFCLENGANLFEAVPYYCCAFDLLMDQYKIGRTNKPYDT